MPIETMATTSRGAGLTVDGGLTGCASGYEIGAKLLVNFQNLYVRGQA